jgi:mono/diheme cytochrome c family protein
MKTLIKLAVFSLLVIGVYTLFGAVYVPQGAREREAPAGPAALGAGEELTPEGLVALGRSIFNGKGSCTLCHNSRGRAPLLEDVAIRASERIKDPAYKGSARSAADYIVESMTEPSAFVVKGFGVPDGKGGEVSPMPVVTGPEIGLTETEVRAVAAFLQDLAGQEVTVTPSRAPGP